jgi:BirA family biotin operon repressor/biotin-[acetyl-CoA-carboxylase] ligase
MRTELTTLFTGRRIIKVDYVTSTNRFLSKWLNEAKDGMPTEGTAMLANYQTAGEGMAGNYWHSEKGKNLLISYLFMPQFLSVNKIFLLNKAISLAVHQCVCTLLQPTKYDVRIKWPNDIYVNDEKICGIKIENVIRDSRIKLVIVGIGLNVNQILFPQEVPNPTSLKLITGKDYSLEECFIALSNELEKQYLRLRIGQHQIKDDYLKSLYRKDRLSDFEDASGRFQGVIKNVDEDGKLCIEETGGKLVKYNMKDIKLLFS